jgi:hypothetical protein
MPWISIDSPILFGWVLALKQMLPEQLDLALGSGGGWPLDEFSGHPHERPAGGCLGIGLQDRPLILYRLGDLLIEGHEAQIINRYASQETIHGSTDFAESLLGLLIVPG